MKFVTCGSQETVQGSSTPATVEHQVEGYPTAFEGANRSRAVLKQTARATDKDERNINGFVGELGRIPQMPLGSRARRRADNWWVLAFHALAWAITAAQAPPAPQPAEQPPAAPGLLPPALPPELVEKDGQFVLPTVTLVPPRPKTGRGGLSSFVEGIKGNDAIVEVVLGQGRILTTRVDFTGQGRRAVIALGDPSVLDFVVLSPRQLRLIGHRLGTTDLSITATDGEIFNFEVHVVADLTLLEMRLKSLFPDASLELSQASGNIVVEGQARSPAQVSRIIQIITTHVGALTVPVASGGGGGGAGAMFPPAAPNQGVLTETPSPAGVPIVTPAAMVSPELNPSMRELNTVLGPPRIVNLIRVPTSQQVLLKVRVAELNRSSLREIGANFLGVDPKTGAIVGTQIAGPSTGIGLDRRLAQSARGEGRRTVRRRGDFRDDQVRRSSAFSRTTISSSC